METPSLASVTRSADIAPHAGQRVDIHATLRRPEMRKGGPNATPWLGTALELDDGTIIWVTYGDPPVGWDSLVDRRVLVTGRIWNGPPPDRMQAQMAPHVTECELPVASAP